MVFDRTQNYFFKWVHVCATKPAKIKSLFKKQKRMKKKLNQKIYHIIAKYKHRSKVIEC